MSLKDTFKQMKELLSDIMSDLDKSENGNKAASQRVRTGTVRMEKLAKQYRKESIASEKKTKGQKTTATKKTVSKAKPATTKAKPTTANKSKSSTVKATSKPKAIAKTSKKATTQARPRQLSVRKPTAKLPSKKK